MTGEKNVYRMSQYYIWEFTPGYVIPIILVVISDNFVARHCEFEGKESRDNSTAIYIAPQYLSLHFLSFSLSHWASFVQIT